MKPIDVEKTEQQAENHSFSKENTLLETIEIIVNGIDKEGWSEDFFTIYEKPLQSFADKYALNKIEALFFSVFINNYYNSQLDFKDLSTRLKCTAIKILKHNDAINTLVKRRLLQEHKNKHSSFFSIPSDVLSAIQTNSVYVPKSLNNLTIYDFFYALETLFEDRLKDDLTYEQLQNEVFSLINCNPKLPFNKKFSKISYAIRESDQLLFFYMCHLLVNDDTDCIALYDIKRICNPLEYKSTKELLKIGKNNLIHCNLITNKKENYLIDKNSYCLTTYAKKEYLSDFSFSKQTKKIDEKLFDHHKIVVKELFYNEIEAQQIQALAQLLDPKQFAGIQKRLEKQGMRKGINILFYGEPGTGKTETALQIAKQSGRDIMQVNPSQTKSCWFGESEKKMQENLDGILIATTNLITNIDDAFERRFLYKVKFQKPCLEAKIQIWENLALINTTNKKSIQLTEEEIISLATTYDFSGGEIENIIRKATIAFIIKGDSLNMNYIKQLCKEELWTKANDKKIIGFKKYSL